MQYDQCLSFFILLFWDLLFYLHILKYLRNLHNVNHMEKYVQSLLSDNFHLMNLLIDVLILNLYMVHNFFNYFYNFHTKHLCSWKVTIKIYWCLLPPSFSIQHFLFNSLFQILLNQSKTIYLRFLDNYFKNSYSKFTELHVT